MSYANGRLPASVLAPIPGGHLRKDAAAAWNAMNAESIRRGWGQLGIADSYRPLGSPGDYSRGVWSQWAAYERMQHGGNLAAYPGTSNHGNGTTVDVTRKTRWVIDQIGAKYGFSKSWSDAQSEWWHILFRPNKVTAHIPKPFVTLHKGMHGDRVKWVQWRLLAHGYKAPKKGHKHRGHFGALTKRSVRKFQKAHGLVVDGKVGPATHAKLKHKTKKEKKR